jgi:hypothetical protein
MIIFVIIATIIVSIIPDKIFIPSRESKINENQTKLTPEMDNHPPILHSDEFQNPIPLKEINTAGAEDSPFIYNDELYFFFTPDPRIPVQQQLTDKVTGIYISEFINNNWTRPKRIILQDEGKHALDGCAYANENELYFCSARTNYNGMNWFKAERKNHQWKDWEPVEFKKEYEVGELHIYKDELYFHSDREGGIGLKDIWMSKRINNEWQTPTNIININTPENEGMPFITEDGKELWFTRKYLGSPALFRSKKANTYWLAPELIISQFAGEPTLDKKGNLYFVHHYFKDNQMLEADIYVAYKK